MSSIKISKSWDKKVFKTFQIHANIFDFGINFLISNDLERAIKFVNYKFDLPNKTEVALTTDELNCLGKRFYKYGYCPIVWLPNYPKTPEEIGTAIHEIFHAVCDCLRWADIPLTNSSEEAYCHLLSYVTKKFFIQVNK